MARGLNKVQLIGRLGKDPELKYTQSGTAYCRFSMATEETWKDTKGDKQSRVEWHDVITWDKLADIAQKYLFKGSQVYVEGRIQSREYEHEGAKRRSFQIVSDGLLLLGGSPTERSDPKEEGPAPGGGTRNFYDDDIPF